MFYCPVYRHRSYFKIMSINIDEYTLTDIHYYVEHNKKYYTKEELNYMRLIYVKLYGTELNDQNYIKLFSKYYNCVKNKIISQ